MFYIYISARDTIRGPDLNASSRLFVQAFRKGHLGKINLDVDLLPG